MWWLPLALAVPGYFLWTAVHEGAHALAVLITGGRVLTFKPWPHRVEGIWFFGRMVRDGGKDTLVHLAPFVLDFVAFCALVYPVTIVQGAGWWALMTALALPVVNTAVGVLGRFRAVHKTDLRKVSWQWAVPFFALMLVYVSVVVGLLVWKLTQ